MKTLTLLVLSLFTLSSMASLPVGKVDVQRVIFSVKQGKNAHAKMKKNFESKKKLLEKEGQKVKKLQENFQKQSLVMNDKVKSQKQREIQEKVIAIQKKTMGYQKEMQQLEAKLNKPILERVSSIVEQVSKKEGVELTFEAKTAPVLYAKKVVDLTDKVIKAYNAKHP